jgi:hypothetical protein
MPITPTSTVDPTVMTNNWSAGLQSPTNQQKLIYKYTHPRVAFNANPTHAQAALLSGVQRAVAANKYANSMAAVDINKAGDNMATYGGANWSNAGTNKKYKFAAVAPALAAAITAVKNTVGAMPAGRGQNNKARMNAWFDGMGAYYGKIKGQ